MNTISKALNIRNLLISKSDSDTNKIDPNLDPIPPFIGSSSIKLIILGQDPTVKNVKSRSKIKTTLNLDKNNALKRYIDEICKELNISIDNVYATNLFKYFFTNPPASNFPILLEHLEPNLQLVLEEINQFKQVPIIILGEPLLKLLTDKNNKVRLYWDYNAKTKDSNLNFKFSNKNENKLNRDIYPIPHQPSIRKEFYRKNFQKYIKIINNSIK